MMERTFAKGIILYAGIALFSISVCLSQFPDESDNNNNDNSTLNVCLGINDCSECIKMYHSCAWCSDDRLYSGSNYSRCDTYDNMYGSGMCADITYPENSIDIMENAPLGDEDDSHTGHAVQISPQKITVKLRVGQSVTVRVSVRQAQDYPLDLYYLMDVSKSLKDDLVSLRFLGRALVRKLKRLTSNLKLGYGTFVDKTALPFVILDTDTCHGTSCCPDCDPPFSYKNELSLTNNTRRFYDRVSHTIVSTNLDTVEGGFDALLQAAVCKNEIGWRDRARRMLVFVTDAGFHFAGDGKLAGIVRPNDGKCHMGTSSKYYNQSATQDYPSIGQINEILQLHNIVPVFAVPDGRLTRLYTDLAEMISGAKIGMLASNSNNVVDLVVDQFQAISSEIHLVDNSSDIVDVSYTSNCTNGVATSESYKCTGLQLSETVTFDVKITGKDCTKGYKRRKFTIRPVGFDETLSVFIKVVCNCPCARTKVRDLNHCNRANGTFACGQCHCDPGHYGERCECSGKSNSDIHEVSGCKAPNSTIPCHGRGDCICNQCDCNKRLNSRELITGKYCECDNFSCDRYQGLMCGGTRRGECECDQTSKRSQCKCKPGFTGRACECLQSTAGCKTPSGLLCNGFGDCVCGKCKCDSSTHYFGPTCEQCPTCIGLCSSYRECVLCKVFDSGLLSPEQCHMCGVDIREVDYLANVTVNYECQWRYDDNCTIHYGYTTNSDGSHVVYAQTNKVCRKGVAAEQPAVMDWKWLVMGIVLAIITLGFIIIMLIRLCLFCHDSQEYARFEKETSNTKWITGDNPLFKPTVTTFANPMHGEEDINQNLLETRLSVTD